MKGEDNRENKEQETKHKEVVQWDGYLMFMRVEQLLHSWQAPTLSKYLGIIFTCSLLAYWLCMIKKFCTPSLTWDKLQRKLPAGSLVSSKGNVT